MKLAVFLCGVFVLTEAMPQATQPQQPQQEVVPDIVAAYDAYHTLWLAEATRNTKTTLPAHKTPAQEQPIAQTPAQEQLKAQQPAQEQPTPQVKVAAQQPAQVQVKAQQPVQIQFAAQQPAQVKLAVQQPVQVQVAAPQPVQVQVAAQQPAQVKLAAPQPAQVHTVAKPEPQPIAEVKQSPQQAVVEVVAAANAAAQPAPDMPAAFREFLSLWKAEAARNSVAPKSTHKVQVKTTPQVQQAVLPQQELPQQAQPQPQQQTEKVTLKVSAAPVVLSAADMDAEFARFHNVWKMEAARNARVPTAVAAPRRALNLLPQAGLTPAFTAPGGKHPVLVGTPVVPRGLSGVPRGLSGVPRGLHGAPVNQHGGPIYVMFGKPHQQQVVV